MLRKIVKVLTYVVIGMDILYLLTRQPEYALTRIIFLILIVWAWKLY